MSLFEKEMLMVFYFVADSSYVGFGLSLNVERKKELKGNEYIVMLMFSHL